MKYTINSVGVILNPKENTILKTKKTRIVISTARKNGILYGVLSLYSNDRGFTQGLKFEDSNIIKNTNELLEREKERIIEFMENGDAQIIKKLLKKTSNLQLF